MTTPGRKQYLNIKRAHPDEVLLFRMGDFYETFDDDARLISKELEIALTSREMGQGERIPLAGIPYHALEPHLAKLIRKGHRVAICQWREDNAVGHRVTTITRADHHRPCRQSHYNERRLPPPLHKLAPPNFQE